MDQTQAAPAATLYIVATPLGNLADWSDRARETVQRADVVAAEDTRHSKKLLAAFGIDRALISLHEHNEAARSEEVLQWLGAGRSVALISDAGTPLVSDPGQRVVEAARRAGFRVSPIPGPSAVVAALSAVGLRADAFTFRGFLPSKSSARRKQLEGLREVVETQVFFESCHRIAATVEDMVEVFGSARQAAVAREMTKLHEQIETGPLEGLLRRLHQEAIPARGEFVVMVAGADATTDAETEIEARRLLPMLLEEMAPSRAAKLAARYLGLNRRRCFEIAEELRSGTD